MPSPEQIGVFNAPVDRTGGLSCGLSGPEDPQQNLSGENSLPPDQNLPQSSTGKLALIEDIQHPGAEQPVVSPQMKQVVAKFVKEYGIDLSQPGTCLPIIDIRTPLTRWVIANRDRHISLTRCFVKKDGTLTPDQIMTFPLGSTGEESAEGPQAEMTEQEMLNAISGLVAKVRRDVARGLLFETLLEDTGVLQRLEEEAVVPSVESPNPFRIWQTEEHESWWAAHPQEHEAYLQAEAKRKEVLAHLSLGIRIGHSFGEIILNPDRRPLPPWPGQAGK